MPHLGYLTSVVARRSLPAALGLWFISAAAEAQRLPIKTELGITNVSGCEGTVPPVSGAPASLEANAELRELLGVALDASRQGDHATARDALVHAARLAPGDAPIAHDLGREHEALKETLPAVREYCRYLAIWPHAPDANDVRGRIARLTPSKALESQGDGRTVFRAGVVLLQRREYEAADSELTLAARLLPTSPEPVYNRALARAARGMRSAAQQDFRRYLQLAADTSDRRMVERAMQRLPRRFDSPPAIFLTGLAFPGLGQFVTGRPVLGSVALGAVGGVLVWALQWRREYEPFMRSNGAGGQVGDSSVVYVHPNAGAGYTYAAIIWVAAAYESFNYAERSQARAASIIAQARSGRDDVRFVLAGLPRQRMGVGLSVAFGGAGGGRTAPTAGAGSSDLR